MKKNLTRLIQIIYLFIIIYSRSFLKYLALLSQKDKSNLSVKLFSAENEFPWKTMQRMLI